jgi:hypothetical protein
MNNNTILNFKEWYIMAFTLHLNANTENIICINNNIELSNIKIERLYYIKHFLVTYDNIKGIIVSINDLNVLLYKQNEIIEYFDNTWSFPLVIKLCNYNDFRDVRVKINKIRSDKVMRSVVTNLFNMNYEFIYISNKVSLIKSVWRMYKQYKIYNKIYNKILLIQPIILGWLVRLKLKYIKDCIIKIETLMYTYLHSQKYVKKMNKMNKIYTKCIIKSIVSLYIDKAVYRVNNYKQLEQFKNKLKVEYNIIQIIYDDIETKHKTIDNLQENIHIKTRGIDICNKSIEIRNSRIEKRSKYNEIKSISLNDINIKSLIEMEKNNIEIITSKLEYKYDREFNNIINKNNLDNLCNGILLKHKPSKFSLFNKAILYQFKYNIDDSLFTYSSINTLIKKTVILDKANIIGVYINKDNPVIFTLIIKRHKYNNKLLNFETSNSVICKNIINTIILILN